MPLVTLTTDFGTTDGYVAQMKGVILGICPDARLVDVSHEVPPQDLERAALLLQDVVAAFPPQTVHLVVVDPGVGTQRPIVAAELGPWRFVAPDNGVLTAVARKHGTRLVVECTEPEWWRPAVSNTFHGRDVMAPLAAHWAAGADPRRFGGERPSLAVELPNWEPTVEADGIRGRVLYADRFGNLVTNVTASHLERVKSPATVLVAEQTAVPGVNTYGEVAAGETLALLGSGNRLEIAVNGGSAAERFGWSRGDTLPVRVPLERIGDDG